MTEFVLFSGPAVVYVIVRSRGRDPSAATALDRIGASRGAPSDYGWALVLLAPLLAASWLAIALAPVGVVDDPGVTIARVTSTGAVVGVALRAVGEEVFFRGLLGGVLVRRLGFARGNLLQAAAFVVPHLALLLIDAGMWPIVVIQFAAGYALGWLRHRTGTFVPGAVVHVVTNIVAGLVTA
ncbi:CPBP family intramembrane glutamic endopeptidase [Dietzia lutea]|uniref:CAAX protease n=1 Tax=Dietzia lutea TaxID=546160 RepID=A0A2S1R4C1_9ACTN|nr:CPBP family intramembrane glutamic endopeptidase [Dietzia lutea]AWH91129.1 CAAX protease [Dietzia lutea]